MHGTRGTASLPCPSELGLARPPPPWPPQVATPLPPAQKPHPAPNSAPQTRSSKRLWRSGRIPPPRRDSSCRSPPLPPVTKIPPHSRPPPAARSKPAPFHATSSPDTATFAPPFAVL